MALHHEHVVAGCAHLQSGHLGIGVGKTGQVILTGNRIGAVQPIQRVAVRKACDLQAIGLLETLYRGTGLSVVGGIAFAAEKTELRQALLQMELLLRGHLHQQLGIHGL